MKIKLPKELAESLPSPDDEGLIRVTAALKVAGDGKAEIVSLNDKPLPSGDDEPDDDESPAAMLPAPSPDMGGDY